MAISPDMLRQNDTQTNDIDMQKVESALLTMLTCCTLQSRVTFPPPRCAALYSISGLEIQRISFIPAFFCFKMIMLEDQSQNVSLIIFIPALFCFRIIMLVDQSQIPLHYFTHCLRVGAATTASAAGFGKKKSVAGTLDIEFLHLYTTYVSTHKQHRFNFARRIADSHRLAVWLSLPQVDLSICTCIYYNYWYSSY